MCHGDKGVTKRRQQSFPSGHTSWSRKNRVAACSKSSKGSFAGLGFLSLYLSGKIKVFDRQGHIAKLSQAVLPRLAVSLVGASRVDDYWQQVFAGAQDQNDNSIYDAIPFYMSLPWAFRFMTLKGTCPSEILISRSLEQEVFTSRDAYTNMMLRLAQRLAYGQQRELVGREEDPKAATLFEKRVRKQLVLEIYKSMVASLELATEAWFIFC